MLVWPLNLTIKETLVLAVSETGTRQLHTSIPSGDKLRLEEEAKAKWMLTEMKWSGWIILCAATFNIH